MREDTSQARHHHESLLGAILAKRYVIVGAIGPDGWAYRWLAFDMLSLQRVHVRILAHPQPSGRRALSFEVVDEYTPLLAPPPRCSPTVAEGATEPPLALQPPKLSDQLQFNPRGPFVPRQVSATEAVHANRLEAAWFAQGEELQTSNDWQEPNRKGHTTLEERAQQLSPEELAKYCL